jgi:hypothetical protein
MDPRDRLDEYGEEKISYSHGGPKPVQPIIGIIHSITCCISTVSTFIRMYTSSDSTYKVYNLQKKRR